MFKPTNVLNIYEFHNGKKVVKADPIKVNIALRSWKESAFFDDWKLATVQLTAVEDKVDLAQLEAIDRIANNARQAFPEAQHLSTADAFLLVNDFLEYIAALKKKPVVLPKSLPPARKPCRKRPITKPSADSTSTAK
jgi:hypothetical protein